MSFVCDWCNKKLSSQQWLDHHKYKTIVPCNLICRNCNLKLGSKFLYKEHAKDCQKVTKCPDSKTLLLTNEAATPQVEQTLRPRHNGTTVRAVKKKKEEKEIIPITDFNVDILRQLLQGGIELPDGEPFEQEFVVEDDYETIVGADGKTTVQLGCKKVFYVKVWNAQKAITRDMLFNSMRSMSKDVALKTVTKEMMYKMINPANPEFHNIYQSDMNRGTIRVLQREEQSQNPYWSVFPKQSASTVVNDYARKLLTFLVETGMNLLTPGIWVRPKVMCLMLVGQYDKSIVLYERRNKLEVKNIAKGELIACEEIKVITDGLKPLILERKQELFESVKREMLLSDNDLDEWLQVARSGCVKSQIKN